MRRALSALVGAGFAGWMLAACGRTERSATDPTFELGCTLIGPRVSPSVALLHPGDTLRVSATETTCAGEAPAPVRWASSDTLVAVVGANDGLVRARARGTATILASDVRAASLKGAMALTVTQ